MKILLRLLVYLSPYRLHILGAVLCGGVSALMTAAHAWLIKPALDRLFIERQPAMLVWIPAAICVVALLKGLFEYAHLYLIRRVGIRVIEGIQNQLYRHILLLPIGYHQRQETGSLISHVIYDTHLIEAAFSTIIKDLIQQTITIVCLAAVLVYQNTMLAGMTLLGIPIFIWPLMRYGKRLRRIAHGAQEKAGNLTHLLHETFSGIRVVKAFAQEACESRRMADCVASYYRRIMRTAALSDAARSLIEVMASLSIASVIWLGGHQVFSGAMTPGEFFSFMAAALMMYGPIKNLSTSGHVLQQAMAAAERIFATLEMPNEPQHDQGALAPATLSGRVEIRQVCFAYHPGQPVLSEISLAAQPGEIIALVGHSGAGKSTLINLILRFFEPDSGDILFDGIPYRHIKLSTLRRHIGVVSQEVVLFDQTIRWNLAYGYPEASEAQIQEAAEAAYADGFIQKMPHGYDTVIEKGGLSLSGGERQRLAIARALLKNPPLLILDEATSALDTESEHIVRRAIMNLVKNRTTFVIAHRLSTIQQATRIAVFDHGRLVEIGRHDALLQQGGTYHRIYNLQFRCGQRDTSQEPLQAPLYEAEPVIP